MVGPDAGADVLWVGSLGSGGEPDQVAEENSDDLPLLETRVRRAEAERSPALQTELRALGVLLPTGRTDRHGASLTACSPGGNTGATRPTEISRDRARRFRGESAPLGRVLQTGRIPPRLGAPSLNPKVEGSIPSRPIPGRFIRGTAFAALGSSWRRRHGPNRRPIACRFGGCLAPTRRSLRRCRCSDRCPRLSSPMSRRGSR